MFAVAARRCFLSTNAKLASPSIILGNQARSVVTLYNNNNTNITNFFQQQQPQRRQISSTPPALQSAPPIDTTAEETTKKDHSASTILDRFIVTAEVTVSKIFPAGFGWQTASIIAESNFGFLPTSTAFALTTGLGDALGVLMGHCSYYAIKKAAVDSSINLTRELHTGILLGSAAFCSGAAWQPLVDILQGANLSFTGVFAGTWVGCGTMFYFGLRAGRTILPGFLEHVHEPTYENSTRDAALSVAIGGATGFFVGTDAAYLPEQNFLIDVVGIKEGTGDLMGCAIAGSSTALGFTAAQSGMNVIYPKGKCWND